jgi:hypothetical protein
MNIMRLFIPGLIVLTMAACGGGSSSDGSGGGSADAVYTGTSNVVLSAPGVTPQTFPIGITITVSGGKVNISDATGVGGTAPLSADGINYTVPVKFTTNVSGTACTFTIVHTGKLSGKTTSGTISGNSPCTNAGVRFTVTTTGSFSATQSGAAKTIVGKSFSGATNSFVQDSL